jgi:hypothetical protein
MADDARTGSEAGPKAPSQAQAFLQQFDILILRVTIAGLAGALFYGASAGACRIAPATAAAASGAARCSDAPWLGALLAFVFAMAALAVGAFAGFLFGLPRSLTANVSRPEASSGEDAGASDDHSAGSARGRFQGIGSDVNTNLERISNWLTTVIVGVGLTKLEAIPGALTSFGQTVDPYFGAGGAIFGVGGGLFFAITGFFLAYVGTRVKLATVFGQSQVDVAAIFITPAEKAAVALSGGTPLSAATIGLGSAAGATSPPDDSELKRADDALLQKSLADLKSDDQIIAWANAKMRAGDPQSALTAYRDVAQRVRLTEPQTRDFALVLAAVGDASGAANTLDAYKTTAGQGIPDELQVRQEISTVSLQARLRDGLWKPAGAKGYEDSIRAGEELVKQPEGDRVAINHVWLACAYGQKLGNLKKAAASGGPPVPPQDEPGSLTRRAVVQLQRAMEIEPGMKSLIGNLYDPARQVGDDNDLQPFFRTPEIDALLVPGPRPAS